MRFKSTREQDQVQPGRVRVYDREGASPVSVSGTRQSECTVYTRGDEGASS